MAGVVVGVTAGAALIGLLVAWILKKKMTASFREYEQMADDELSENEADAEKGAAEQPIK